RQGHYADRPRPQGPREVRLAASRMTLSPKNLARALYLAARDESDADARAALTNLMAAARRSGLVSALPAVLAVLPQVMEEVDALRRVTVESSVEIDQAVAVKAVAKAGIKADPADVVRAVVPELIGGFRIRTPDRTIDASV